MSSVARRERKYGGESDRTKRVVYQPVQAWERKWVESSRGGGYQVCKWVKSDKEIEFEDDEEEEEEEEEVMDTEKEPTTATELEPSTATTPDVPQPEKVENKTEETPDLPATTGLGNAVDQKIAQIEEEEQTHTPKLDDVSDHEPEPEESTVADRDNPAAYPAFNPHKQAQLLETETDSLDTTPQGTQDEEMEDTSGLDTFQSNTATPDYPDYGVDRAREVLDTNMSEGTSMEPSLSRSSINDDTPAASGEFDQ